VATAHGSEVVRHDSDVLALHWNMDERYAEYQGARTKKMAYDDQTANYHQSIDCIPLYNKIHVQHEIYMPSACGIRNISRLM
jgi:hypothetical protein